MMVLALVSRRFANMLGESVEKTEGYILPKYLSDAEPVTYKTREDNAPFSPITFDL